MQNSANTIQGRIAILKSSQIGGSKGGSFGDLPDLSFSLSGAHLMGIVPDWMGGKILFMCLGGSFLMGENKTHEQIEFP